MNISRRALLAAALGITSESRARAQLKATSVPLFVGTWSAFLAADDPPTRLKLVIDGDCVGHLTVIGVGDFPISRLQIARDSLLLQVSNPSIIYKARLVDGKIHGVLRRGSKDIPLTFRRGDLYSEPPLIEFPPAALSADRLHELRLMSRAPAMGVAWQFAGGARKVLIDGVRAVERDVPVTRHDRWHLGSITKSMTATLAARLVDAGEISWHTSIADVLGSEVPGMLFAYRGVSLLHILSHRGGLLRDVDPVPATRLEYARAALVQPQVAATGTQMVYSNVDYVVAGLMLEIVAKKSWEELVRAEVFEPLGISSAGFGPPGLRESLDQPQGHEPAPDGIRSTRFDVPDAMSPAGRVHMDLDDLLIYLGAHRDCTGRYLTQRSWTTLHTPPFGGDYALGWTVAADGTLSHGGTNQKWKAEVLIDRKRALVCGCVANILNNNTESALLQLEASARLSP